MWDRGSVICTGLTQLLTVPLCGMGYIWALSHSCILYENAQIYSEIEETERLPDDDLGDPNNFDDD